MQLSWPESLARLPAPHHMEGEWWWKDAEGNWWQDRWYRMRSGWWWRPPNQWWRKEPDPPPEVQMTPQDPPPPSLEAAIDVLTAELRRAGLKRRRGDDDMQ